VAGGILAIAHPKALASSTVVIGDGAKVVIDDGVDAFVYGLELSSSSVLDIGFGSVTISTGMTQAEVVSELRRGKGGGVWDGLAGITSGVVTADLLLGKPRTLGWKSNLDGSFTVAYAASGDGNLDGEVDILDAAYFIFENKFGTGQQATWLQGDYNLDGIVDVLDLGDFVATGLYNAGPYNAPAASISAVPEPSTYAMALAGFTGCGYSFFRRRKQA
jgi:hypothetical protein